jgi:CBS domain containing-hemolysin-like protein
MVLVDHDDKLEPIFGYFKRGMTHIAVVTQTKTAAYEVKGKICYRDPVKEVIGIVTMEDIIE